MIQALACAAAWAGAVDALPSVVGEPGQPPEDAILGDLDGDGEDELVVAVPTADAGGHEAGAIVWVFSPKTLAPLSRLADEATVVLTGEAPQDHAGTSLVVAGDVDGDGYADLAVGAPDATTDEAVVGGKVYVVYGGAAPDRSTSSLGDGDAANGIDRFDGGSAWGRVGERVFEAGDANDDGIADLLVGAPVPTPDGETGTGWLGLVAPIERGTGGVLAFAPEAVAEGLAAVWTVAGTQTLAGRSAAVIPDADGDGRDDIVLGAPGVGHDLESEATRGAAFLFLAPPPDALTQTETPIFDETSAVATIVGRELGDAFPWSIQALSDRVVFAVPEEDTGRGAVYLFASLADGTTSTADRALHGTAQGDLLGRGVADARAFGAFLLVGAPGSGGGLGTVVLAAEPDGAAGIGTVALGSIDGCWSDGQLGHTVRGSDEGAVAITAPFASVYGAVDGIAAILDPKDLDALDAECTHGDTTIADADGDGTPASLDCDDAAAWRHPGALEVCGDDVDDDCDGDADEDCGPPLADPGCSGCASGPRAKLVTALLALALVRRRALVLCLASGAAHAHELDALEAADHRLWGSTSNEYLHGPVADLDGDLAVANFQGIQQAFAVGEVALVERAGLRTEVLLSEAPVTLHGSSEHDYFGVAVAAEGTALFVGIDHSGLTENGAGEVVLFLDPWDGPATPADVRLSGEHAGDSLGTVLDLGSDLDGDGSRDLAVGAPTFAYGQDRPEQPGDCTDWVAPPLVSGAVYVVHDAVAALADDGPIAVRERCAPGLVSDASSATAVIQSPDPDEATFFGARVLTTDLDGDGYGDLLVTSWGSDTSGTVSFFPGPIAPGDLDLERDDAAGTLRSGDPASFTGWSLVAPPDGSAVAVGSQNARLWVVADAPSGSVALGEPTASGDSGSGFATALAWGPALLVGAPHADEVHVLDGETFASRGVLRGAPMLGWWVGWIPSIESDLPDAVLTAPAATRDLAHQGVALIIDGRSAVEGDAAEDEAGCGCAAAPASPIALFVALLAIPASRCRRRQTTRQAYGTHRRSHRGPGRRARTPSASS